MDQLAELRMLIYRHAAGQRGHSRRLFDGVQVSRLDTATEPSAGLAEASVALMASGVKRTLLNGVPYEYRAGQYLVTSLDLPVDAAASTASEAELADVEVAGGEAGFAVG